MQNSGKKQQLGDNKNIHPRSLAFKIAPDKWWLEVGRLYIFHLGWQLFASFLSCNMLGLQCLLNCLGFCFLCVFPCIGHVVRNQCRIRSTHFNGLELESFPYMFRKISYTYRMARLTSFPVRYVLPSPLRFSLFLPRPRPPVHLPQFPPFPMPLPPPRPLGSTSVKVI